MQHVGDYIHWIVAGAGTFGFTAILAIVGAMMSRSKHGMLKAIGIVVFLYGAVGFLGYTGHVLFGWPKKM